jgi:hypothetical protein
MTERTNRANWDADQQYRHHLEMQEKRAAWEQERKHQREQQARARKQAELADYLQRRAEEWEASTGSTDGLGEQLPRWRAAYLDAREAEAEAERRQKMAEVEAEHYNKGA